MTLSVALDTNVLARLLVNDDPAQADHLGLVWLQGEVESTAMGQWLAQPDRDRRLAGGPSRGSSPVPREQPQCLR
ncbi:MAG: hypothetical protein QE276_05865 [Cyanobium sp. D14.bin.5]|jgi:hypothetical protein|nr:hypothetical protein [Cyanobium sp. D14.bin.5]